MAGQLDGRLQTKPAATSNSHNRSLKPSFPYTRVKIGDGSPQSPYYTRKLIKSSCGVASSKHIPPLNPNEESLLMNVNRALAFLFCNHVKSCLAHRCHLLDRASSHAEIKASSPFVFVFFCGLPPHCVSRFPPGC